MLYEQPQNPGGHFWRKTLPVLVFLRLLQASWLHKPQEGSWIGFINTRQEYRRVATLRGGIASPRSCPAQFHFCALWRNSCAVYPAVHLCKVLHNVQSCRCDHEGCPANEKLHFDTLSDNWIWSWVSSVSVWILTKSSMYQLVVLDFFISETGCSYLAQAAIEITVFWTTHLSVCIHYRGNSPYTITFDLYLQRSPVFQLKNKQFRWLKVQWLKWKITIFINQLNALL